LLRSTTGKKGDLFTSPLTTWQESGREEKFCREKEYPNSPSKLDRVEKKRGKHRGEGKRRVKGGERMKKVGVW